MIYIASDHGGFILKEQIKAALSEQNIPYVDCGPSQFDPADDYPDFAKLVAQKVSVDVSNMGILLCRSGQGVNIVANKFKNVRAALVWNEKEAIASRSDDLANVLSIPTDYISVGDAKKIVSTFLTTPLGTAERHVRRIEKIKAIEEEVFK